MFTRNTNPGQIYGSGRYTKFTAAAVIQKLHRFTAVVVVVVVAVVVVVIIMIIMMIMIIIILTIVY